MNNESRREVVNAATFLRGLVRHLAGPAGWFFVLAIFWVGILRNVELPGLYMDAINPDYLAAFWLNPGISNPHWMIPAVGMPTLGGLYHGMQNLYVGLLTYNVLGTSVTSARISQALFGAAIVLLVWLILRRSTDRPILAVALAVALATDIAFLGSFRTQSYIILSGQVWMLLAFYLVLRVVQDQQVTKWLLPLSGVSMGLAVYGYFVFLFFIPPLAAMAILGPGGSGGMRRMVVWGGGLVVGMLPYVIGYMELVIALGGIKPFMEWIANALHGLNPIDGSPSYWEGVKDVLLYARLGLTGIGNEYLIVGEPVSAALIPWRVAGVALAGAICLLGAWLEWRRHRHQAWVLLVTAALPASYLLAAAWFGSRLSAHHFTVLVAVGYVMIGMATGWLGTRLAKRHFPALFGTLLALGLISTNLVHQNKVHARLVATGGVGLSTDALTSLSRMALTEKGRTVWFFPDWGFFMPFVFLTSNQVPYEVELTEQAIKRHPQTSLEILRVVFWKAEDAQRHRDLLEHNGISDVHLSQMKRRDGQPAFYILTGRRVRNLSSKHELLKHPDFSFEEGWTFSPGAIYDASSHSVLVSASSPVTQEVPVKPGHQYRNIVVARCAAKPTLGRLQINWHDAQWNFIKADGIQFNCARDWTEYEMTVTAPADAIMAVVYTSGHTNEPVAYKSNSLLQ